MPNNKLRSHCPEIKWLQTIRVKVPPDARIVLLLINLFCFFVRSLLLHLLCLRLITFIIGIFWLLLIAVNERKEKLSIGFHCGYFISFESFDCDTFDGIFCAQLLGIDDEQVAIPATS